MSKRIANAKMADKAKKVKTDNENIKNCKAFNKNEIEELVDREAIIFIKLFHKSFYEKDFYQKYQNRIKKEEPSADGNLNSADGVISDIISKIVAKIRSLINLDSKVKKQNEEDRKHKKTNFLKVIDSFFHSFFNSTKKTQW